MRPENENVTTNEERLAAALAYDAIAGILEHGVPAEVAARMARQNAQALRDAAKEPDRECAI